MRQKLGAFCCGMVLSFAVASFAQIHHTIPPTKPKDEFVRTFAQPPDETRPMMRWWWFGPAVEKEELSRELLVMRQASIGGVEIQPVYPLAVDDESKVLGTCRIFRRLLLTA